MLAVASAVLYRFALVDQDGKVLQTDSRLKTTRFNKSFHLRLLCFSATAGESGMDATGSTSVMSLFIRIVPGRSRQCHCCTTAVA